MTKVNKKNASAIIGGFDPSEQCPTPPKTEEKLVCQLPGGGGLLIRCPRVT